MQSYFAHRRHKVNCAGVSSHEVAVKYGVPQGFVLGPLCYIIAYVNDLITNVTTNTEANIIMYADYTLLLVGNSCPAAAIDSMQRVLDKVSSWCHNNKLTVNAKKQNKCKR